MVLSERKRVRMLEKGRSDNVGRCFCCIRRWPIQILLLLDDQLFTNLWRMTVSPVKMCCVRVTLILGESFYRLAHSHVFSTKC